jgi:hypothetical protein
MTGQIIPLDNSPNQSFQTTLSVDGKNLTLGFVIRYNEQADYWQMTIKEAVTGNIILDCIPLVTGDYPAANLLEQYSYLSIGSVAILNMSGVTMENPDKTNLGTDFVLWWGDTL